MSRYSRNETGPQFTRSKATAPGMMAWMVLLTAIAPCMAGNLDVPQAPVVLGPGGDGFLATMPDGLVDLIYSRQTATGMEVACQRTADDGRTWSAAESMLSLNPADVGTKLPLATLPLVTRDGHLQLFFMAERGTGSNPAVDYFIDVRQAHSQQSLASWSPNQRIFEGYVGSLNGVTQLGSGRIVLPFAAGWAARPQDRPPDAT